MYRGKNVRKILLLGSAPYVSEWYTTHGEKYEKDGFKLAAINNSWAVSPGNLQMWFRSEDYFFIPTTKKPTEEQRSGWVETVEMLDFPFYYQKRGGGGTILFNVICHLMNMTFANKTKLWLSMAGCDLIYKPGAKNWFYGKGTPDPMRLGEQRLRDTLTMFKEMAEKFNCVLANAGGQEETLLPFARHEL